MTATVSRRGFLKLSAWAGTGLVIGFRLDEVDAAPVNMALQEAAFEPNAYLRIGADGTILMRVHRSEMGQGVNTSIPMLVAEELEVGLDAITIEQAPPDRVYGDQVTGGSVSISSSFRTVRNAGAAARMMLIAAAAQQWGVDPATCHAENGVVIHDESQATYAELVEIAATMPVPGNRDIQLKEPGEFRVIGQPQPMRDGPDIVTGRAQFCSDIQLPGMLIAMVTHCPVFSGKVASFDDSAALQVPGVKQVIEIDRRVVVVAETTWAAIQGSNALEITWDEGRSADLSSSAQRQQILDELKPNDDPNQIEGIYEVPFLAHATLEPMTCVADVRADGCEVWAPTQDRQSAQRIASRASGFSSEEIIVHVPLIGGGFGRRLQVDYVEEAVAISKAVGAPIKLFWTREEDMQHDYYHPAGFFRAFATLDEAERVQQVPLGGISGVPTGAWRSVENFDEAFVYCGFVDEVAAATGKDPLDVHLAGSSSALQAVIQLAAEKAGWGTPLPEGWGRGLAAFATFGVTPVCHIVEASVEDGKVIVHRVVSAVDCGIIVNPDTLIAQVEGGVIFGLSAALYGDVPIENGRAQISNYHNYPVLRIDETPVIEVYILPSENTPQGIGEGGVPPVVPALINALYAATGKRIRHIPIRAEDLQS